MTTTPVSLLERLRQPDAQDAWARFTQLYTPLLYYWARRMRLQPDDAGDLVQDVFAQLVVKLPEFVYEPGKRFRAWLRTVTLNKYRDRLRSRGHQSLAHGDAGLQDVADTAAPDLDGEEFRRHLARRALEVMQADFQPTTWRACWEQVVADRPAAEVAAELGITVGAAYAARFRVLGRLRQELHGLLD
jgi:RNA polymerase sigma-70 factor (ECF subfamily)